MILIHPPHPKLRNLVGKTKKIRPSEHIHPPWTCSICWPVQRAEPWVPWLIQLTTSRASCTSRSELTRLNGCVYWLSFSKSKSNSSAVLPSLSVTILVPECHSGPRSRIRPLCSGHKRLTVGVAQQRRVRVGNDIAVLSRHTHTQNIGPGT